MYSLINSCRSFLEGKCPHQKGMVRVSAIPQLMDPEEVEEYQNLCLTCLQCKQTGRKGSRAPVSFLVRCQRADLTILGGKGYIFKYTQSSSDEYSGNQSQA